MSNDRIKLGDCSKGGIPLLQKSCLIVQNFLDLSWIAVPTVSSCTSKIEAFVIL